MQAQGSCNISVKARWERGGARVAFMCTGKGWKKREKTFNKKQTKRGKKKSTRMFE